MQLKSDDVGRHDVCIVGAGPAGLQAGSLLKQKGLRVVILERGSGVASFFRTFPRQRNLISINKVHTGLSEAEQRLRFDWNSLLSEDGPLCTDWSRKYFPKADEYVRYLEEFATALKDEIRLHADVTRIARDGTGFALTLADGDTLRAAQVLVATGVTKPWLPEDVDGLEHVELYHDYDADPERFTNKRVLILGKGNAALETAESLIETTQAIHVMSPNPVKLAWNSHFVGHLRAVNTNFLDTYQLKSQNAMLDAAPMKIERKDGQIIVTAKMTAAEGHEIVLAYDHVIACTGFRWDATILDEEIRPELRHFGKFPEMTQNWESTQAPGLWFAGTVMQSLDFKKTMSGFVHGFRHNIAALTTFIANRAQGGSYPTDRVDLDLAALEFEIRERISLSAAIFLQPGFLCDVIRLDGPEAGQRLRDVPIGWAKESVLTTGRYLTVTLEFGNFGANPLHVKRQHNFDGEPDPFIHPVLRLWENGEAVATRHFSDHLDADWRDLERRDPGTVQAMTYADQGRTMAPGKAVQAQLVAFLTEIGLGAATTATAAE